MSYSWRLKDPWNVALQGPLSMGFFRQESWSGLPFPSLRDLPDPGVEPGSPALQADSLLSGPLRGPFFLGRPHGQASLLGLMRRW